MSTPPLGARRTIAPTAPLRRARRAAVALFAVALAAWPSAPSAAPRPKRDSGAAARAHDKEKPMIERSPEVAAAVPALVEELVKKHGEGARARAARGVEQVASLWRPADGSADDFRAFVREQFVHGDKPLAELLARLEWSFEQLDGHLDDVRRDWKRPTDLDLGPLLAIDPLLAGYDPAAHVTEDLFGAKVAFVALLDFPLTTLAERLDRGSQYSRREWAELRLAGRFARRVPGEVRQAIAREGAASDLYIAQYNVWMHHVLDEQGARLFPKGMRLISHWNLRDELKADYADPKAGRAKQRAILAVMERIVTQTIPRDVIDNPRLDWNPFTNAVTPAPAAEVEEGAPAPRAQQPGPEPNTRYAHLLAQYRAQRGADPYTPTTPTAIARSFELEREIPEARVKAMLEEVLASPLVPRVAKEIERRLGRKLGPEDLWYDGFRPRSRFSEADLDAMTKRRYPTADAFAADVPRILGALGFTPERAKYVASHIVVEPARGAGHAMPAARRGDPPRLRTRIDPGGMSYKGYNIAVHELGHNVEQVFSLYDVDHTLLAGVPNNAFTEALAFVFQARDLELLGLTKRGAGAADAEAERARVLNDFWQTWEIAGVSLVDIAAWHWMYDHPSATPAELRDAVVKLARDTWDRYYAPVLGSPGTALLGIYSHTIAYPLYLCDYPIGHMIAFQIEEHLKQAPALGPEFERMAKYGSVVPDVWMVHATGAPVGPAALLRATERALTAPAGAASPSVK